MGIQAPLKLFWIAWYDKPYPERDTEIFPQYDSKTGEEHLYKEVNQARVRSMVFMPFWDELADKINAKPDSTPVEVDPLLQHYVVHLNEGERLVTLRRNRLDYTLTPARKVQVLTRSIIYILGWQKTRRVQTQKGNIELKNTKVFMYIHEDGLVELASDDRIH